VVPPAPGAAYHAEVMCVLCSLLLLRCQVFVQAAFGPDWIARAIDQTKPTISRAIATFPILPRALSLR